MENSAVVAIIGAGPLGIELAVALQSAKISFCIFDKAQLGQSVYNYPPNTRFFSSSDKIAIAGIPLQTEDQQKCTRENYLSYLRTVVDHYELTLNTYEEVIEVSRINESHFQLKTKSNKGIQTYQVNYVVFATGSTSYPRMLKVPGEEAPHVDCKMGDPHKYFKKKVAIVGGRNSAAETALRCFYAGANVTLVTRAKEFNEKSIKYWILPDLLSRIKQGQIHCHYDSEVKEIQPNKVILKHLLNNEVTEITADFVIKAIGFDADMSLCRQLGVEVISTLNHPSFNTKTMETNVPGIYVLGTIIGGTQNHYKIFIENSHHHVVKILESIQDKLGIIEDNITLDWLVASGANNSRLEE